MRNSSCWRSEEERRGLNARLSLEWGKFPGPIWRRPHIALFKFVDVVFARDHESLPRVPQVTDDVEEDAGVGAAAADVAGADGDAVLYH